MDVILYILATVFLVDLLFIHTVVPKTREKGYSGKFESPSVWIPFDGLYKAFAFMAGSIVAFNFAISGLGLVGIFASLVLLFPVIRYCEGGSPLTSVPVDRIWVKEGRFNPTYANTPETRGMVRKYNFPRFSVDVVGLFSIILLVTV